MRSRLPLILIALTFVLAFVATGCGDKSSPETVESVPSGATQTTSSGSTGSNGAASASAKSTYKACIKAAESISDPDSSKQVKKSCKESYKNIEDSSAKIDQATSDARAQCEAAAAKIPNAEAKSSALAACAQFK